jgi:RNA polymerase sigma-70 factor (ECF subfamily)
VAAASGDRVALSDFIRSTQSDVWRFVARSASPRVADDLTQETYLRVLAALPGFEGRSSARTWLLAIARNVVVDRIRHDLARPQLTGGPEGADMLNSAPVCFDPTSDLQVECLLGTLLAERREALVLTQLLGFSYTEAADICGCPVGTIRSRVARARADLVDVLARQLAD